MFPALAVGRPFACSAGDASMIALVAPRILNELIGCRPSHFERLSAHHFVPELDQGPFRLPAVSPYVRDAAGTPLGPGQGGPGAGQPPGHASGPGRDTRAGSTG